MKNNQTLAIFIAMIVLTTLVCSLKQSKDKPFRGYFYIQRFYPGTDVIDSIQESEFHMSLMFFEVNKDVIFFSKSLARVKDIEGIFRINKIK